MVKKIFAIVLCLALLTFVGCNEKEVVSDATASTVEPSIIEINPLTGIKLDSQKENHRPVAIMVNNAGKAKGVQSGLSKADIIYETEVEGGLTRLLAVYSDITAAEKIGSVRSARYPHVDFAMGHNAVYVHCGFNVFCKQHLSDTDSIDLNKKATGSKRIANGLSTEHTVYALTEELWERISNECQTAVANDHTWVNFTTEGENLSLTGGAATAIKVPFPANTTEFKYDEQTGLYSRVIDSSAQKDYFTEDETKVKNVFVLLTDMSYYGDNYTRQVSLTGGDGYYMTNGTYTFIKWTKGAASDSFKFTDTEGNELKVSAGNSWVCVANKNTCNPTME